MSRLPISTLRVRRFSTVCFWTPAGGIWPPPRKWGDETLRPASGRTAAGPTSQLMVSTGVVPLPRGPSTRAACCDLAAEAPRSVRSAARGSDRGPIHSHRTKIRVPIPGGVGIYGGAFQTPSDNAPLAAVGAIICAAGYGMFTAVTVPTS